MNQSPSQDARFQRMFTAHRDSVWVYCYRRLPRDDVQDAVAEVYLVAWRRIDQAPEGDETLLWLYGVARNVVRNFHRSTIRRQRLRVKVGAVHQPSDPTPEMQVIRRAEDRELLAAVVRLKPWSRSFSVSAPERSCPWTRSRRWSVCRPAASSPDSREYAEGLRLCSTSQRSVLTKH